MEAENSKINKQAKSKGPDFLVIGAARSGSSWLYHRLKRHGEIFVPPIKELHYFDIHKVYPFFHWIRLRRIILHLRRYVQYVFDDARNNGESNWWLIKWGLGYFFKAKTDRWYSKLFDNERGRISGEITPAYALLDLNIIQDIRRINPDVKIVFQMRDPIDRAWSQTVMHLKLHKRSGSYDQYEDEIRRVIFRDEVLKRSDYISTIEKWEDVFAESNMCYLFYDEIRDCPDILLKRLFEFLGVSAVDENAIDETLRKRVAERDTKGREIPRAIAVDLARHFLPMLKNMESRFGEYPGVWLDRAEELLK